MTNSLTFIGYIIQGLKYSLVFKILSKQRSLSDFWGDIWDVKINCSRSDLGWPWPAMAWGGPVFLARD